MDRFQLDEVARLPQPGDNAAVAVRRLEAGTRLEGSSGGYRLSHTVLEGHRFAVTPIQPGEALLSWRLPFGVALRAIEPGDYLANQAVLEALRSRAVDVDLPAEPNFANRILTYDLDPGGFNPAPPLQPIEDGLTFNGYVRPGERGVGTRNTIVLLGLSSYTNGYVRRLAARLQSRLQSPTAGVPNLDGVAALAHTEGSQPGAENRELVLRTLAGLVVHPNAAAVLLVEQPGDPLAWEDLRSWMVQHGYPLAHVLHAPLRLSGDFESDLQRGEEAAAGWLEHVCAVSRSPQPLSELKIALQCGGSDAFSGISGNPLAALAAREVIRRGGAALLSETPELVGAETYVLARARSLETARRFLEVQARFKAQVGRYGVSVEGNISGGNRYRGLYNITLKSIGAARKRHPDVPLDGVLEYADRLDAPGYYFMDSPGNDLESIAGQVASGCNLIIFVTGNGSVTNFPFVPTIKVVTTTGRYRLMPGEMDVNAGRYLDGEPLEALGEELLGLLRSAAGGQKTAGEQAGHSQIHLWRSAPVEQENQTVVAKSLPARRVSFEKLRIAVDVFTMPHGFAPERVGLILPGSLCSAQVAGLYAARLTELGVGQRAGIQRFVALPHTEGCGSSGNTDEMLIQTLAGYLRSPLMACGAVLEHGCERTLNDVLQRGFAELGLDPTAIGWASVQMDGGLQGAFEKLANWFRDWAASRTAPQKVGAGMEAVRLGLLAHGSVGEPAAGALAALTQAVAEGGGTVVAAQTLPSALPLRETFELDYLQTPPGPGLYCMRFPTTQWTEMHSGLGAVGVNVILGWTGTPLPGHPLVPLLQVAAGERPGVDLALNGDPDCWPEQLLDRVAAVLSGEYIPLALALGNVDFQLTRGWEGVSL